MERQSHSRESVGVRMNESMLTKYAKASSNNLNDHILKFFGDFESARKYAHLYEVVYETSDAETLDDGTMRITETITLRLKSDHNG